MLNCLLSGSTQHEKRRCLVDAAARSGEGSCAAEESHQAPGARAGKRTRQGDTGSRLDLSKHRPGKGQSRPSDSPGSRSLYCFDPARCSHLNWVDCVVPCWQGVVNKHTHFLPADAATVRWLPAHAELQEISHLPEEVHVSAAERFPGHGGGHAACARSHGRLPRRAVSRDAERPGAAAHAVPRRCQNRHRYLKVRSLCAEQ